MTRQLGKLVGASVSAAMLLLASGWGVGSATAADCTLADLQSIAPADTTVTAVSLVPPAGSLPEYCRVDAFVATPGNTVNFRLGLPTGWNGKFYFVGVGGFRFLDRQRSLPVPSVHNSPRNAFSKIACSRRPNSPFVSS